LEPVSSEEQLVGRGAILDALTSMSTSATVGSAVIRGQKRVGKTSIVRALQSRLLRTDASIGVAFLEVGPYGGSSVASTVERLASQVCRELRGTIDDDKGVDPPVFTDGSAVAVVEFVDELRQRNPNKQWLLVLDEFDELPPNVFGAEDLARSFFMTLRALSSQPYVGVILIGGEKMEFALALHGDAINKFTDYRVDYVDFRDNFGDFSELVRAPAQGVLEISDEAVARLHEETQGHPYFTKLICRALWEKAVKTRDAHVTVREVEDGIREAVAAAATPSFQHFWSDGVRGSAEEQATVSLERRKLFIALAEVLRTERPAPETEIVAAASRLEMTRNQATAVLRECLQREVLVAHGDAYEPKVPFFTRWLQEYGPARIGAQLAGSDVLTHFEGVRMNFV
jgi:hypothetical protein